MAKGRKADNKIQYFDYTLLTVVLFLLCIGLIMLYSVSSYDANLTFDDPMYYIKNQFKNTLIGIGGMLVVMNIDYHRWYKWSKVFYFASAVLIALVVTPLGYEANGARRWLNLGVSLQPAEVAKVGLIIFLASAVCKMGTKRLVDWRNLYRVFGPALIISLMVWRITDNLSSAIIIMGIAVVMVYMGTPGYKPYIVIILSAALIAGIVILLVSKGILTEELSYRFGRIRAWIYPEAYASTTAFQTLQALYAIGSGGIFGKGLGQSLQKQFVPEAQNDMIFSIICEELGIFGAVFAAAAVIAFTKAMAKELGPSNINVNCIAPGFIETQMNASVSTEDARAFADDTPLCRLGKTIDIANTALFLASDDASFITGQVISVDGGIVI